MVGSALARRLKPQNPDLLLPSHDELNLLSSHEVYDYFLNHHPRRVYMAAGLVGGIQANMDRPTEFFTENMAMAMHVMRAAFIVNVERLMYFGSSCAYPVSKADGATPGALLTGPIEPSNEAYGLAKATACRLATYYHDQYGCDFRAVMPCNLYGPNDNYHPRNSHVVAALVRKFVEAPKDGEVCIWGDGTAKREFLYVDDLAEAAIHLMAEPEWFSLRNVGSGHATSIEELAVTLAEITEFTGNIRWQSDKPVGTPVKVMGGPETWQRTTLRKGLEWTVNHYRKSIGM
jgi:GDP-L-fucose synthase